MTSEELQKAREAADQANHIERVEWLSRPDPKWVDGVPVDAYTRKVLLQQSEAALKANPTPAPRERDSE